MGILIRPFQQGDSPTLRELTVSAFEGVSIDHNIDSRLGTIAGRDWRWRKARDVDRDMTDERSTLAVAVDETLAEVVGYVTMQCDEETRIGCIHNLVVRSELRGQGLGRRLIEHALEHFRSAGMAVARIDTLEQNAIGGYLYRSVGFEEVARQIRFAMSLVDQPEQDR
jgi:ribosomal protein S18 acetylase RimI-like enzyme